MSFSAATEKLETSRRGAVDASAITPGLALLYLVWVLSLFEPQRFIASFTGGGSFMQRLVLLLLLPTLLVAVRNAGARAFYLPLTLFVLLHAFNVPFSHNRGLAFAGFKGITVIFILFSATVSLVDTPEKALRMLKLFLVGLVWYLVQGVRSGRVQWHATLGNPDSFGTLAAIAIGFGFYAGMAAPIPRWRYLGFAAAALGMLGIVTSFARGAFLSCAVVVALVWVRSPRKMATLASGVVAAALLLVAISAIYPEGEFWDEVSSITEEGTTAGTGKDRWEIWRAALMVFREHPVFGAGAYNVGVVGGEIIPYGSLDLKYKDPATLYNKMLHNVYLQILSEEGMVGLALWLWMLSDFVRNTRRMRSAKSIAAWNRSFTTPFDLRRISIGLEVAMAAYLCGAIFYNLTYRHWYFALLALALVTSESVRNRNQMESSAAGVD